MPISHQLKTIFVHIPKNAGESIERTLGMYGGNPNDTLWGTINNSEVLQHLIAPELRKKIPSTLWDEYFKFAVVRNPWSKAVSEYNWYLRYGPSIPFSEWVNSLEKRLQINTSINIFENGHNIEQFKYVFNDEGKLIVDKIIRFENLKAEFDSMCSERNWNYKLIHAETTASSSRIDFRQYYDVISAREIAKIYHRDLEVFGYSQTETFKDFKLSTEPVQLDSLLGRSKTLSTRKKIKNLSLSILFNSRSKK